MWKNYSADYIRHNWPAGISIAAASFIAALFLSFLGCLFYNFWLDSVESAKQETGDWHGRITGAIDGNDLAVVNGFANVERAVVNETLSGERGTVVDVSFYDKKDVYRDMYAIVQTLGLPQEEADYNYQLLSLYFIRIPGDEMPRLLLPFYLLIVAVMCLSLILVIHNSFAVSMNSRIHQFGIFASVGATPKQIRTCLLQEAIVLSAAPVLTGIVLGAALSFGTVCLMGDFAENLVGGRRMSFGMHPAVWLLILLLAVLTVLVSAWIPAKRLSRLTPMEAIRGTEELQLKRRRIGALLPTGCPVLYALFGMEGELAGSALKAQKRALRTTSVSLTLAFFGFMVTQCFWTLSGISTNHTYFEKYQDAWDIMVTVKDTDIEDFTRTEEIRGVPGAKSVIAYQKAEAVCILPKDLQSQELMALGGLEKLSEGEVSSDEETFQIKAPVVILDDESFREFCGQVGIDFRLDGAIIFNRFWDSVNSNFRYPAYIPYVKENMKTVVLQNAAAKDLPVQQAQVEIPVLLCTQSYPLLREEYEESDYSLVQFISASLWEETKGQIGGARQDTYVRVLADGRTESAGLHALEEEITQIIGPQYEVESENRIQEKIDNDKMIKGYETILGAFCVLLAVIGIAHVFSHTLGFLRQRKREFARYLSVGVTPEGIRKIFCIEALITVGRPFFVTFALTVLAVALMIRESFLDPMEFIREAPVQPILLFVLAVAAFVAFAYYLGGKKVLRVDLADALRDDTMI